MIDKQSINGNIFEALNIIDKMSELSIGARFLASNILRKHSDWLINWAWFANEFNVSKSSISRWKDELIKAGVWRIEQAENKKIKIVFLINIAPQKKSSEILENEVDCVEFHQNILSLNKNNLSLTDDEAQGLNNENSALCDDSVAPVQPVANLDLVAPVQPVAPAEPIEEIYKVNLFNNNKYSQKSKNDTLRKDKVKSPLQKAQKIKFLAKECFDSLDLRDFSDDECRAILEYFEFRAENQRKSPFSLRTASKLYKQFLRSKALNHDVGAICDRLISNGWVGYEWGEKELYLDYAKPKTQGGVSRWGQNVPLKADFCIPKLPLFFSPQDEQRFILNELVKTDEYFATIEGMSDNERILNTKILGRNIEFKNGYLAFIQNTEIRQRRAEFQR